MRNLKRALSLAMATVMLMSMTVISAGALSFNDADDISNVSAATVLEALEIMIGDDEGNFNPDSVVTRAEMAIILCRVVYGTDYEADGYVGITSFTDVSGHWAEGEIGVAYANGWINGKSAESFDPNATVLAYEAYVMLQRALGYYDSADSTEYSLGTYAMSLASKTGMSTGISTGAYTGLTRDSVASAVYYTMFDTPKVAYSSWTGTYYACDIDEEENWEVSITNPSISIGFGDIGTFANDVHDVEITREYDVMGRPVDAVVVDGDTLATVAIDIEATFVAGDELEDVEDAADYDDLYYYFNGAEADNIDNLFSGDDDDDEIYNGYVVEVYNDDDNDDDEDVTVYVAYFYYVDEIDDIEYDDDEEWTEIETADNGTFYVDGDVTDTYEEGDMIIFTVGSIESDGGDDGDTYADVLDFATAVEGDITGVKSDSYYYLDGTKYSFATEFGSGDGSYGETYALYLDPNGYVIYEDEIEGVATAYDYLYVLGVSVSDSYDDYSLSLKVVFADGATSAIDIDEIDGLDMDDWADEGTKNWYTGATTAEGVESAFTVKYGTGVFEFDENADGTYDIDYVDNYNSADADAIYVDTNNRKAYVLEGYTRLRNDYSTGGDVINYKSGVTAYFTDDTVFVDENNGDSYVGYENVNDMYKEKNGSDYVGFSAGELVAVVDDGEVLVLFAIGGDSSSSGDAGTYVYVEDAGDMYTTEIDDDTYYVYYGVYIDGECVELIADSKYFADDYYIYDITLDDDGYVIDARDVTTKGDDEDGNTFVQDLYVASVGSTYISAETVSDNDGKGSTDYRFEYDSDTIFVQIDEDGDVSSASKSKIVTGSAGSITDDDDYSLIHVVYDDDGYALIVFIQQFEDGLEPALNNNEVNTDEQYDYVK